MSCWVRIFGPPGEWQHTPVPHLAAEGTNPGVVVDTDPGAAADTAADRMPADIRLAVPPARKPGEGAAGNPVQMSFHN